MKESKTKLHSFTLDDDIAALIDRMADATSSNKSQTVRQSVAAAAGVLEAAKHDSYESLAIIRERYDDDTRLLAFVTEDENGNPVGHLNIDKAEHGVDADFRAIPKLVKLEDGVEKVLLFLEVVGGHVSLQPTLARFGDNFVLISHARFPLCVLDWPRNPREAFLLRLGDVAQLSDAAPARKELVEL